MFTNNKGVTYQPEHVSLYACSVASRALILWKESLLVSAYLYFGSTGLAYVRNLVGKQEYVNCKAQNKILKYITWWEWLECEQKSLIWFYDETNARYIYQNISLCLSATVRTFALWQQLLRGYWIMTYSYEKRITHLYPNTANLASHRCWETKCFHAFMGEVGQHWEIFSNLEVVLRAHVDVIEALTCRRRDIRSDVHTLVAFVWFAYAPKRYPRCAFSCTAMKPALQTHVWVFS